MFADFCLRVYRKEGEWRKSSNELKGWEDMIWEAKEVRRGECESWEGNKDCCHGYAQGYDLYVNPSIWSILQCKRIGFLWRWISFAGTLSFAVSITLLPLSIALLRLSAEYLSFLVHVYWLYYFVYFFLSVCQILFISLSFLSSLGSTQNSYISLSSVTRIQLQ